MSYADAVLQGNLAKLRAAPVGTRNITLAQVAFRLFQFAPMAWTMEAMADVLDHEARLLGLERREIRDTLRSAERGAAKKILPYDTLIKVAQGRPPSFQAVPREPEPTTHTDVGDSFDSEADMGARIVSDNELGAGSAIERLRPNAKNGTQVPADEPTEPEP